MLYITPANCRCRQTTICIFNLNYIYRSGFGTGFNLTLIITSDIRVSVRGKHNWIFALGKHTHIAREHNLEFPFHILYDCVSTIGFSVCCMYSVNVPKSKFKYGMPDIHLWLPISRSRCRICWTRAPAATASLLSLITNFGHSGCRFRLFCTRGSDSWNCISASGCNGGHSTNTGGIRCDHYLVWGPNKSVGWRPMRTERHYIIIAADRAGAVLGGIRLLLLN